MAKIEDEELPSPEWQRVIDEEQKKTKWVIGGKVYPRIPYGSDWEKVRGICHDCEVRTGQYHVDGCDMEKCPCCGGQLISCDCDYSEEETGAGFDFRAHGQNAVNAYLVQRPLYEKACSVFESIIKEALARRDIKFHSVQSRAKSPDHFRAKAALPSTSDPSQPKYTDPLCQITDLAGVRIIAFVPSALKNIDLLIREEFDIRERSDKSDELIAEDRFGYASVHYLVALSHNRAGLAEYERYKDITVEIQVRTILQHAWAEIEHDIQYKSSSVIPTDIRRRFTALAGLLEIADREFQAVQDEDQRLRQEARALIKQGDIDLVEITPDALKSFLNRRLWVDKRITAATYEFLARCLRQMGFLNLRQVEACIAGYDGAHLGKLAYGAKQGQAFTLELMLLAGMGETFSSLHPFAGADWFHMRNADFLNFFEQAGVQIRTFTPGSVEVIEF